MISIFLKFYFFILVAPQRDFYKVDTMVFLIRVLGLEQLVQALRQFSPGIQSHF